MSSLEYLQKHFIDKAAFAALVGISIEQLDRFIAIGAVSEPTYTCDGMTIRSAVFGVIPVDEPIVGEFFRPECARWARIADDAPQGSERTTVLAAVTREMRDFVSSPEVSRRPQFWGRVPSIETIADEYFPPFWDGTFGLCVADPSTGAGIMRKGLLQARLEEVTDNGMNPLPKGISATELLQLIDAYACSAMPFSPAEYERSSRKRLIDDLRPIVIRALASTVTSE